MKVIRFSEIPTIQCIVWLVFHVSEKESSCEDVGREGEVWPP